MFRNILFLVIFAIYTLIIFGVFVIVWLFSLPFDKKRKVTQWYSRLWSKGIYKLRPQWHTDFVGFEKIEPNQTYLIMSNHQSMLDIPLVLHIKKNFRWVSKEEVYKIPVFGWVLWMRGDIAIKRGGTASAKRMIKDCTKCFEEGVSVALFPEGTRTKTGQMNDLHSGGFLVAKRGQVPILPVVINGNFDAFDPKTSAKRHYFTVKVLDPISVAEIDSLTMEELRDKVENIMKNEFNNICQKK